MPHGTEQKMIYNGKDGLTDLAETIDHATDQLTVHASEFDTIVVTGMSGLLVGPAVAARMGKRLVAVRKPHDDSHTRCHPGLAKWSNDPQDIGRWIFLDDMCATGRTRDRVMRELSHLNVAGTYAGNYLYASWGTFSRGGTWKRCTCADCTIRDSEAGTTAAAPEAAKVSDHKLTVIGQIGTRGEIRSTAIMHGWTVTDYGCVTDYRKGERKIRLGYSRNGVILDGYYGTASKPISGRGKRDKVMQLLTRWE